MTADSFDDDTRSPAKSEAKISPPKSMKKSFRESAYDTESDDDQPKMFKKQQEVTVKGPTIDVAKALLSQLKLQTVTQ